MALPSTWKMPLDSLAFTGWVCGQMPSSGCDPRRQGLLRPPRPARRCGRLGWRRGQGGAPRLGRGLHRLVADHHQAGLVGGDHAHRGFGDLDRRRRRGGAWSGGHASGVGPSEPPGEPRSIVAGEDRVRSSFATSEARGRRAVRATILHATCDGSRVDPDAPWRTRLDANQPVLSWWSGHDPAHGPPSYVTASAPRPRSSNPLQPQGVLQFSDRVPTSQHQRASDDAPASRDPEANAVREVRAVPAASARASRPGSGRATGSSTPRCGARSTCGTATRR